MSYGVPAKRPISEFIAMTQAQREALTWEEVSAFVCPDTLEIAAWGGLRRSGLAPWEALCRLKGLNLMETGEKQ